MEQKTVKYMNATVCGLILLLLGGTISLHQFKVPMNMGDIAGLVGMSGESAPWLMSIFTVIGVFLAIPAGSLVAKQGAKNVVLLAGLFAAVGSLVGAFATNGTLLLISRAIEGIGFVMVAVAGPSTVISTVEPGRIAGTIGIWACWVPLGNIVAYNLTPALFGSTGGFKVPWLAYAALSFVMVLVVKGGVKAPQGVEAPSGEAPSASLGDLLKKKNFMLAALTFTCYNYLFMAWLTFVPGFAVANGIMTSAEVGFAASLPMFICFVSSPAFGNLAGKIGCKKIYIATLIITGIGFVLGFVPSKALIYVAAICIGIGLGHPGMIFAAAGELVDGEGALMGLSNGMIITLQNLGMFLGTATFMTLVGITGGNYLTAALFTIPITLLGVIMSAVAKFR